MKKRVVLYMVAMLFLLASTLGSAGTKVSAADSRLFPETGKTVTDPFLDYWDNHGGLAQQGYPITDAYQEKNDADGKTYNTQYFERARFEYHPENAGTQYEVLLGLLGKEALAAKYGNKPPTAPKQVVPGGGSRLFSETGKTVTGLFLTYWEENGGLAQQGFPITEAYNEKNDADGKTYITQYFERARFEYHPENADPYKVLLGLVGKEVYGRKQGTGGTGGNNTKMWSGLDATPPFDAVAVWPDDSPYPGKAFFFTGTEYYRYDIETNKTDPGYPLPIKDVWPGMPFEKVDNVLVVAYLGMAFFFSGNQYAAYNIAEDKVEAGYPVAIKGTFKDVPFTSIDASAVWPDNSPYANKLFLFQGKEYVRYDLTTGKMDPYYPQPIKGFWPGLPFDSVDAVVVWPNGKAYFFKGNEYASYDIIADKTDPGYPKPIK